MKRYRVISYSFDTRATLLNTEINANWEDRVKETWHTNKTRIREGLIHEFGALDHKRKIQNFTDLGAMPMSLLAFHNEFLKQCRNAFIISAYYPALVAACTLGERILNHLLIRLRDYYKDSPEYKKIYRKKSFDKWSDAINILAIWGVMLEASEKKFRQLETIRHRSVHFNPETDTNARKLALEAITLLQEIVVDQFSAFGTQPWYIPGIKGAAYVAKDYERTPFVKEVVLPCCKLVGPKHRLENKNNSWVVIDDNEYESKEISDLKFASLIQ